MSSIYYPYFLIEKNTHKTYKHKSNIIVLALFSKDVLIPLRHILCLGEDEFDILMKYDRLIAKGVFYFRLPVGITDIEEYYTAIKTSLRGISKKTAEYRISKLNAIIPDVTKLKRYDPTIQQEYFSNRIKHFLYGYLLKHNRLRCRDELNKLVSFELISKEVFDDTIKKLKDSGVMSKDVFSRLRNVSNVLYFLAGTSDSKLKVCKDDSFAVDKIDEYIQETIHNYDEIVNESFNPVKITHILKDISVIKEIDDLHKLSCDDIIELRSSKWHDKFVSKYCRLSSTQRGLSFLKEKEKMITKLKQLKAFVFSVLFSILSASLSFIIIKNFWQNLIVAVISFFVSELFATLLRKYNWKVGFIDRLLDSILGCFIPEVLYLYKIYEKVNRS